MHTLLTNMIVTAYCSCRLCCGQHATGLAANGHRPIEGVTCAGPRCYPVGTRLYLAGLGYRTVTDRTALQYDGRVDIYFAKHDDAKRFGRKMMRVTILTTLPPSRKESPCGIKPHWYHGRAYEEPMTIFSSLLKIRHPRLVMAHLSTHFRGYGASHACSAPTWAWTL